MAEESISKNQKEYGSINCCSQGASISQILAIGLIIVIQIINLNLVPSMLNQKSPVMHAVMGICYFSFLILIIEYIRLLVIDPSDPRLKKRGYSEDEIEEK